MAARSAEPVRKPRADAIRNRERVLEAAKAVFSAGGPEASLEAVARCAGVGIGTLYRHFPTREALFEAVYRREVQQLSELAEQLKSEADPVDALRRWLRSNVEFVATKKGMSAALALAVQSSSELTAFSFDRLTKAVGACWPAPSPPARYVPTSALKIFCGPWSACATYMTSPAGKRASCGCSMSLSTAFACKPAPTERRLRPATAPQRA